MINDQGGGGGGGHYSNQVRNGGAWNYKKYFAERVPCYNHLN